VNLIFLLAQDTTMSNTFVVGSTFPWDYFDSGITTPSAFLDIFERPDSALTEPYDIPTEFSPLLDNSGSFLDTEDTNSFLEPYISPVTAASSPHGVSHVSFKAIDKSISCREPTYESFWIFPSLPQSQDLEKIVVDAGFDGQVYDILGPNRGIDGPLGTTSQDHFFPGNDGSSTTGFDDLSLDVLEPMPVHDRPSRYIRT
jgi:hypothetical protein